MTLVLFQAAAQNHGADYSANACSADGDSSDGYQLFEDVHF
jgi:hypothetical protein